MKYCEEFAALLDAYADGELSREEAARVREHLETCPGCRSYVDDVLRFRAALPDVEETEVPEGFTEGVMAAVRELESFRKRRRIHSRWRNVLLPLAACFALVVLVRTLPNGGNMAPTSAAGMVPADASADEVLRYSLDSAPEIQTARSAAGGENPENAAEGGGALNDAAEMPEPDSPAPAAAPAYSGGAPKETVTDFTAAPEDSQEDGVSPEQETQPSAEVRLSGMTAPRAIRLTLAEAGELLEDLPCTVGEDGTRCYQLTQADYDTLLESLAERGVTPSEVESSETEVLPEGYVLVYVADT